MSGHWDDIIGALG
ncbi:hypothetical protein LCQ43_02025 [Wolbachia endosymbiont of Drosophila melanogaster]|nr:hypothetical protein [Wolbachia endosymbiont of Drosophila melanogaster]MCE4150866.1 hypothetical protein [Wolbachia endosymbiont of Drosophila melanogaster]